MSLEQALQELRVAARSIPEDQAAVAHYLDLVDSGSPYAELFYTEIEDPAWIPLLEARGWFRQSPEPVHHDDGTTSYPRSLALHGLARLAPKAPTAVATIIAAFPRSGNVVVGDQLMRCVLAIREAEEVPRLLPVAEDLIRSGDRSTRLFLRDVLKSWMEMGRTEEALRLLGTFIDAVVRAEPKLRRDQQTAWELAECDKEILSPLIQTNPASVAAVCFEGLCTYYDASHPRSQKADHEFDEFLDASMDDRGNLTYWLEDFRETGLRRGDPGVILAHRLYLALLPIYRHDPAERDRQDELLVNSGWYLFTRLRCQLYADVPEQTLAFAQREVRVTLDGMSRTNGRHGFEFASMLEAHANHHGHAFLSESEVSAIIRKVREGPLDEDGNLESDPIYQRHFWRHQLWPIRSLLPDYVRQQLDKWAEFDGKKRRDPELEDYKPVRSYGRTGFVKDRSPFTLDDLSALPESELWEVLNTWKKSKDWIENDDLVEESSRELARTFTDLVASIPARFPARSQWWKKLRRPVMLSVPLETWAKSLGSEKDEGANAVGALDLDVAFGIMDYVVSVSQDVAPQVGAAEDSSEKPDWWQARLSAARFLGAYVREKHPLEAYADEQRALLTSLAVGKEKRLDELDHSKNNDWQFEAINSVKGEAWSAIIQLALNEKNYPEIAKGTTSLWIADLLTDRLSPEVSESPAIFSLLGSRLRYLVYVLPDWIEKHKDLLLPLDRWECLQAVVDGHFAYDQAHKLVAERLPDFPSIALDVAERRAKSMAEDGDAAENARDVSSRLGFHIASYVWNDWFPDSKTGADLFDRFLSVATTHARAETLSYIGSAFEKAEINPDTLPLINRAKDLLEQWFSRLRLVASEEGTEPGSIDAELGQFADLVAAECFPFDWRVNTASEALELITRPRWSFQLLDTLEEWSEHGEKQVERVAASIRLLAALTSNLSDELRWSIQTKRLKPILRRGLAHQDVVTRDQTNQVVENLLRHGFFDLLDLGMETDASTE